MKVEIYSDITCPWCYVGEHRFLRALAAFPQSDRVEVVFRPYQLDPTLPQKPQPLIEQLQKKFGPRLDATLRQTAATAKKDGLDLRFALGDASPLSLAKTEPGTQLVALVLHKIEHGMSA